MTLQIMPRAVRLERELVELQHGFAHAQQFGGHVWAVVRTERAADWIAIFVPPFVNQARRGICEWNRCLVFGGHVLGSPCLHPGQG